MINRYQIELWLDADEDVSPERVLARCRWELMEWHHEFYPHNHFGWEGDRIIHFIPMIAQPDEEGEVLGRLKT